MVSLNDLGNKISIQEFEERQFCILCLSRKLRTIIFQRDIVKYCITSNGYEGFFALHFGLAIVPSDLLQIILVNPDPFFNLQELNWLCGSVMLIGAQSNFCGWLMAQKYTDAYV